LPKRLDRRSHSGRGHDRVGIDKDERAAGRGLRARVPGAGNVPELDPNHARTIRVGDGGGAVGRGVVDHDQLVQLRESTRGGVDRHERPAQEPFLVIRRDDEGNHPLAVAVARIGAASHAR
jgi:hypothetical protein